MIPFVGSVLNNSGNFLDASCTLVEQNAFVCLFVCFSPSHSLCMCCHFGCASLNGIILIWSCSIVSVEELKKKYKRKLYFSSAESLKSMKQRITHKHTDTHKIRRNAIKSLELALRYKMNQKHLVNIQKIWKDLNSLISGVLNSGDWAKRRKNILEY